MSKIIDTKVRDFKIRFAKEDDTALSNLANEF